MFKNKSKRVMTMGLSVVLGSCFLISSVGAATGTKNGKLSYNNIKVMYNGAQKYLSVEPFMMDNTVYVPVRGISEISGSEVKWGNNTVYINGGTSTGGSSFTSDQQVAEKNFEIAKLTQENAILKQKLAQYEGSSTSGSTVITDQSLAATLKLLNDDYDDYGNVSWDFELTRKGSRLVLNIEYSSRRDDKEFNNLSESKLDSFIEDLCDDIAYRHKDIEITGELSDSYNDTTYVDFSYSTSGKYKSEFQSTPDTLYRLERELRSKYTSIKGLTTTTNAAPFDLTISNLRLEDYRGSIIVKMETTLVNGSTDHRPDWNALTYSSKSNIERVLYDIYHDVTYDFKNMNVTGELKNISNSPSVIYTFDNNSYRYSTVTQ